MNISESNVIKLQVLINEIYELSTELPNISTDIINTNLNYRAWILNQWLADMSEEIKYGEEYEETDN